MYHVTLSHSRADESEPFKPEFHIEGESRTTQRPRHENSCDRLIHQTWITTPT